MALSTKPNDYIVSQLLAKQAESDRDFESLLWVFARRDYSSLDSKVVEHFTVRIAELRYKTVEAYKSGMFDIRTFDVLPRLNQTSCQIKLYDWGFMSNHPTNARRALTFLDSNRRLERSGPFPFMRLPVEIRQQVYSHMLAGTGRQVKIFGAADNHEYVPWKMTKIHSAKHISKSWSIAFENHSQGELEIDAGILRTCHRIHDEAEPTLYRLHDFGFGTNTPSIVSFLQTISDRARQNIHCIGLAFVAWTRMDGVLRRLMMQDFENWSFACGYVAENLQLDELVFDLDIPTQVSNFEQWRCIQGLLRITGLKRLTQQPLFEENSLRYRALIDGAVVPVRKPEWLDRMNTLLPFLVERMVRKDVIPQELVRWRV